MAFQESMYKDFSNPVATAICMFKKHWQYSGYKTSTYPC